MRDRLLSFVRFGIVGLLATLTHLSIALVGVGFLSLDVFIANVIAFCVAFGVSLFGHYYWTFESDAPRSRVFIRFILVAISGLAISNVVLMVLVGAGIGSDTARLVMSTLAIPVFTYVAGRYWAFT